jgi:hypothetical protein
MSAIIFVRLKSLSRGRKVKEYHGVNSAGLEKAIEDFAASQGLSALGRKKSKKAKKKAKKK